MIKDNEVYNSIPFTAKLCITLIVIIMKYLNKKLDPLGLSPYFCVSMDQDIPPVIEEESKEILQ